jgi:DNA-binding SARP family transcriptional activator
MARLTLTLLGGFEGRLDAGRPLLLSARKAWALLAYLAVPPGQAHPRDKLAALLWGGVPESQARASLRQALLTLRRALREAAPLLRMEGEGVSLAASGVEVDAVRFEQALGPEAQLPLESAVELYRGDLLAGLAVDEPPFEEWLVAHRERLRELALEGLARLLASQRAAGAIAAAVQSALRLLALDPLQEAVHRALMRLYAQLGRRDTALRQYQECVEVLQRDLAVEPEAETKELYQEILRQRPLGPAAPPAVAASGPPLVGRDHEMGRLRERLADAWEGRGSVAAVLGEAGIGKSRVLAELAAEAGRRGGAVLLGRAYETEQILPFAPWVGALRDAGVLEDSRLLESLGAGGQGELARLFPELADPSRAVVADLGEQLRLFETLAQLIRRMARARPVAVLLEDCHWADEMTLRFLAFLGRRLQSDPILVVVSARDEELTISPILRPTLDELEAGGRLSRLTLARLGRDDTLALVRELGRADTEAATVARGEQVWAASEGNPFIVVETMRASGDGGALAAPGVPPLPASVRDLIGRRLSRLSDRARQLARVAAVIGSEFEFALLQQAAGVGEPEAAEGVEELVRRRVLRVAGDRFDFSHERIRDVVAAELLAPRRQLLHAGVAAALEGLAGGDVLRHCAALGGHYRAAGIRDKAAVFLRQAGRQAIERCAYREAVALLEQASAALVSLPETSPTLEQAFEIRLELRNALLPLGDFPAILRHLREATTLAERLGDRVRQVRAAAFLLNQLWMSGDPAAAVAEGERALAMAEALGDPGLLVLIRTRLGEARHVRGDYRDATAVFGQNIAALTGDRALERFGGLSPAAVHSRAWLVSSLSELGRFGEARAVAAEALAIARQLDAPVSLSFAWAGTGMLALQQGRHGDAIEALERALEARRGDNPPWLPRFAGALGLAHAVSGDPARGLGLVEQALAQAEKIGVVGGRSPLLTWLAEARLLARRAAEALDAAEQAVALATRLGERGHLAWALRARAEAEACARADDPERATRSYREAARLATELEMRPLVAHCHLGLGMLYPRTAERANAEEHLASAAALYREMGMGSWLEKAEASLRSRD